MPTKTFSISDITGAVEHLAPDEREIFGRIFQVTTTVGELLAPAAMTDWIEKFFGSMEAVNRQRITKIINLVTMEGALFNELRANRPIETKASQELSQVIAESKGGPFCHPENGTPADVFGRIQGEHAVTASNVAKYDGWHGLVVFNEHNPLAFTSDKVRDYLDTARRWAGAVLARDPEAKYFFLLWNCLWKSGASIVHGHIQMTATHGLHYAKIEGLRRAAVAYGEHYEGKSTARPYFDDLYRVHNALNLAWEREGVRGLAYLAPIKEKEIILLAAEDGPMLYEEIYRILDRFRRLGVKSFNVALIRPPLAPAAENWQGFPIMVRLVDRGDPNNKTADMGGMELYAASVVASDPFRVAAAIRE